MKDVPSSRPDRLVSADWLEHRIGDPDVVVIEVPFHPPGSPASTPGGHIPGAQIRWWKDLCWDDTEREFPDPETMAHRLDALGLTDQRLLVIAGDPIQFGTYAYWVLAMTGLDHLAVVLDGGRTTWLTENRPTVAEPSAAHGNSPSGSVTARAEDRTSRVGRDTVLAALGDPSVTLVDLRSAEEYRGERVAPVTAPFDHGAERAGHIPGAHNLLHEQLLDDTGRFLPAPDIMRIFDDLTGHTSDVIGYCRLSHRASLGWFAATRVADHARFRVYDGSWTEWGSMVGMPVER